MKHVLGISIVLIMWILFAYLFQNTIPLPNEVFLNFVKIFGKQLFTPTLQSISLLFSGLFFSIIIGVHLGIYMGLSKRGNKLLDSVIYSIYPIPKSALLQVLIIIFTSMFWMKSTLIFIIVVFPVIITVKDAIRVIPKEVFYHAKSLSLNKKQMYKDLIIPAILPNLFTTLRISIGNSIAVLYLSETRGIGSGLGYFIDSSVVSNNLNMFTGIFVLSLIGYILFILIDLIEYKFCKWV